MPLKKSQTRSKRKKNQRKTLTRKGGAVEGTPGYLSENVKTLIGNDLYLIIHNSIEDIDLHIHSRLGEPSIARIGNITDRLNAVYVYKQNLSTLLDNIEKKLRLDKNLNLKTKNFVQDYIKKWYPHYICTLLLELLLKDATAQKSDYLSLGKVIQDLGLNIRLPVGMDPDTRETTV
jgi:hypothetical protein